MIGLGLHMYLGDYHAYPVPTAYADTFAGTAA